MRFLLGFVFKRAVSFALCRSFGQRRLGDGVPITVHLLHPMHAQADDVMVDRVLGDLESERVSAALCAGVSAWWWCVRGVCVVVCVCWCECVVVVCVCGDV